MRGWRDKGTKLRQEKATWAWDGVVGMVGFAAGSGVHILDPFALTEPLLARLPVPDPHGEHRIGHFMRNVPRGYRMLSELEDMEDPALREYAGHLREIVSGDLFGRRRLAEIWRLNTGAYDHLIERYLAESDYRTRETP